MVSAAMRPSAPRRRSRRHSASTSTTPAAPRGPGAGRKGVVNTLESVLLLRTWMRSSPDMSTGCPLSEELLQRSDPVDDPEEDSATKPSGLFELSAGRWTGSVWGGFPRTAAGLVSPARRPGLRPAPICPTQKEAVAQELVPSGAGGLAGQLSRICPNRATRALPASPRLSSRTRFDSASRPRVPGNDPGCRPRRWGQAAQEIGAPKRHLGSRRVQPWGFPARPPRPFPGAGPSPPLHQKGTGETTRSRRASS